MKKIINYLKNNFFTILIVCFGVLMLTSSSAKAFVQAGFLKIGLFSPSFKTNKTIVTNENFTIRNSNGKIISIKDLKGKVVFINFWATWCPPCIAEMPTINDLYNSVKNDKDIILITIEIEREENKSKKFLENKDLNLPVYFPVSNIPTVYFNGTLPTTIILDKNGNIAHKTLGLANYNGDNVLHFLDELKSY